MKAQDHYLKSVRWSDEDGAYIEYWPGPVSVGGGRVPSRGRARAYQRLSESVNEEIEALTAAGKTLPEPVTRPMREAVGA